MQVLDAFSVGRVLEIVTLKYLKDYLIVDKYLLLREVLIREVLIREVLIREVLICEVLIPEVLSRRDILKTFWFIFVPKNHMLIF